MKGNSDKSLEREAVDYAYRSLRKDPSNLGAAEFLRSRYDYQNLTDQNWNDLAVSTGFVKKESGRATRRWAYDLAGSLASKVGALASTATGMVLGGYYKSLQAIYNVFGETISESMPSNFMDQVYWMKDLCLGKPVAKIGIYQPLQLLGYVPSIVAGVVVGGALGLAFWGLGGKRLIKASYRRSVGKLIDKFRIKRALRRSKKNSKIGNDKSALTTKRK